MSASNPLQAALEEGRAHHAAGRFQEAEAVYRQILATNPTHAEAIHLLGVLAHQLGNNDVARNLINRSIALNTTSVDFLHNYAEVCIASQLPAEAEQACRRAIAIAEARGQNPSDHFSALCRALRDLRRLNEAVVAGERAVELKPASVAGHLNLANALGDMRQFDQAIAHYQRAIAIKPDNPQVHTSMGTTLAEMGRIDDAIEALGRAIEISDLPDAHWNRSLLRLLMGDFPRGWEEFEWRWQTSNFPSARMSSALPQWDGSPASGQTILLFGEQGAGDMIQFVRYAPMVAERCARTVLVCGPDLKKLLTGVNGVSEVVDYDQQPPQFDQHVPLMSLPKLFKTDLDSIPAPIPYLSADPAKVEQWRTRLGDRPGRKIGLAWAGRITHPNDRNRSMSLAQLAPLGNVENARWVSLQKGPAENEARLAPPVLEITDVSGELKDYSDTAALIANLDLVISVDTSVVHVAGAMGKPVWVLLPFIPDWRWMLDRADSPWYPTMRLFRQKAVGDWEPVAQEIVEELKQR